MDRIMSIIMWWFGCDICHKGSDILYTFWFGIHDGIYNIITSLTVVGHVAQ